MANIMERITTDNKTTYTARIRIKGYHQQTATFPRITDARLWIQKTESLIREGKYFSQAEAKRHTFADMICEEIHAWAMRTHHLVIKHCCGYHL